MTGSTFIKAVKMVLPWVLPNFLLKVKLSFESNGERRIGFSWRKKFSNGPEQIIAKTWT